MPSSIYSCIVKTKHGVYTLTNCVTIHDISCNKSKPFFEQDHEHDSRIKKTNPEKENPDSFVYILWRPNLIENYK